MGRASKRWDQAGRQESLEFPANPYIALADFTLALLLVVILGYASAKAGNEALLQRVIVEKQQQDLLKAMNDKFVLPKPKHPVAIWNKEILCTYQDGDLQRYWIDGRLLFPGGSTTVTRRQRGYWTLRAIGGVLADYDRKNRQRDETGSFKRVLVEGHASPWEGGELRKMEISQERSRSVAAVLQESLLSSKLIEASGRGDRYPPRVPPKERAKLPKGLEPRRVEIIVIYSPGYAEQSSHSSDQILTNQRNKE